MRGPRIIVRFGRRRRNWLQDLEKLRIATLTTLGVGSAMAAGAAVGIPFSFLRQ